MTAKDSNLDDWREETKNRLKRSIIYKCLKEKCDDDSAGQQVLSLIDDAVHYAYQRTKLVIKHMGEFTLHDGSHLFRVLFLMGKILPKETIQKLSIPELMLMILTAFFHDIGMAPSEKKVRAWLEDWENDSPTEWELKEYEKFKRFFDARPEKKSEIERLYNNDQYSKANTLKRYVISEYIRVKHADRARDIIAEEWDGKITYKGTDLTRQFALLCFSHNQDAISLLDMDPSFICGQNTYVCLPFIGVILRLADILDFDAKRTPKVLFSHLGVRHPISIREWMKHRTIESWNITSTKIIFQAKCEHPAIESTIRKFCDQIDKELVACTSVIQNLQDHIRNPFPDYYLIKLPTKVNRSKIGPKEDYHGNPVYYYNDTKFTLSKSQVIDLLMGTKLYGNTEVALRELIQNSIDACLTRKELEDSWDNHYEPKITVEFKNDSNVLAVVDNGIGMDQKIVDNYYSQIGSSFYNSTEFYDLMAEENIKFTPISRFGIGILSCFMVADSLEVETRRVYGPHDSSEPLKVIIEGHESIFWIKSGNRERPGTSTKLLLRKDNPWEVYSFDNLVESVCKAIPNPQVPIEIKSNSETYKHTKESFSKNKLKLIEDRKWSEYSYIRELNMTLKDHSGISGFIKIGLLEIDDMPVKEIKVTSKEVTIDGEDNKYTLNTKINMFRGKIEKSTDSIEVNENEEVNISYSTFPIIESKSKISLHGIEIPMELFPPGYKKQKTKLKLPFPIHIIIDIHGTRDLDLNTARTEITYNEKWFDFAETLIDIILNKISEKVSKKYWDELIRILDELNKNEIFSRSLDKYR